MTKELRQWCRSSILALCLHCTTPLLIAVGWAFAQYRATEQIAGALVCAMVLVQCASLIVGIRAIVAKDGRRGKPLAIVAIALSAVTLLLVIARVAVVLIYA